MQQVGKLQDMQAGHAPAKTGVQRRIPSDEERRLTQQVNEAKRRGGFTVTDPAAQLKSALDGIKTRLRNGIADLEHQIATGKKTVTTKTPVPLDADAQKLQDRHDELKKEYDTIFTKPGLTDVTTPQVKREVSLTARSLNWSANLKPAKFSLEPKKAPLTSADLEAKKARIEALKAERDFARDTIQTPADPDTKAEVALKAFKARTANRIADLLETYRPSMNLDRPKKAPLELDQPARDAQDQATKLKLQFERMVRARELSQRPFWQKALEYGSGVARASALSGYHTLAKLASFSRSPNG